MRGNVGERLRQLGRWLLGLLLLPFRLLWRALRATWRGLGQIGLWLRRQLAALLGAAWRFLGRMGLALRHLLTRFLWRPLRFITTPIRWFYGRFLRRPLAWTAKYLRLLLTLFFILPGRWLLRQLALFMGWLIVRPVRRTSRWLRDTTRRRWAAAAPARYLRRRRWRSRRQVWQARWYLFWHRQQPPRQVEIAPAGPRPYRRRRNTRLATTAATAGLLIAASFFTVKQMPQLGRAVASGTYELNPSKLPLAPTATPAREPTATPLPPTPWPTPDPLNGGGSVAFTLRQDGNSDIYALSIGQSQPVRLTNHPADDRDPAWSPTGRELAFASHRDGNWELYVLDLQSGALDRLTNDPGFDGGPSWSPDGQWLVYESYRNDNLDIYIISRDGQQGPIRLTEDPAPDFAPVWSPGGRHVAFTSWRSGNKDIFIMPLDAASDTAALNVTGTPGEFEDDPAFSPDGQTLAYYDDSSGFELVYTLPLAEYTPAGVPTTRGQGRHPSWSPDSDALAYVSSSETQSHLIASTLDAWSVAPQAFTADGRLDSPAWSAVTLPHELPPYLLAINQTNDPPLFVESVHPPEPEGPPYLLLQMPVDAPAPYLSDRVDQSFLALRDHVIRAAGWDFLGTLDNMYEVLETRPLPGQPDQTWNKAGRAFDYYGRHVLDFEPQLEVGRENQGSELYWRTYLRAARQDGTLGEPLRDLPWDFRARFGAEPAYYDKGGKYQAQIPAGYYVDFTELAADYGWSRVPADDNWRTFFPGIRFWHYENRQGLAWDEAMRELHTPAALEAAFGK